MFKNIFGNPRSFGCLDTTNELVEKPKKEISRKFFVISGIVKTCDELDLIEQQKFPSQIDGHLTRVFVHVFAK